MKGAHKMKLPWKTEKEPTELDRRIDELVSSMAKMQKGSEEYHRAVQDLKDMVDIKLSEEGRKKIDPNTIVSVLGNFGLGLVVVIVEIFGHSITSKGWPGVGRNKV